MNAQMNHATSVIEALLPVQPSATMIILNVTILIVVVVIEVLHPTVALILGEL